MIVELEGELDYSQVVVFCFLFIWDVVIASVRCKLGKCSDLRVPAPFLSQQDTFVMNHYVQHESDFCLRVW